MRRYIGICPKGSTVRRNVLTAETGEPLLLVDQDEITRLRLDFTAYLGTGESIASATVRPEQATVTSSLTSPTLDLTISNVTGYDDGKITVEATLSSSEVWREVIRVRRTQRYGDESRYRDYA